LFKWHHKTVCECFELYAYKCVQKTRPPLWLYYLGLPSSFQL
jgi:hypothetical protein